MTSTRSRRTRSPPPGRPLGKTRRWPGGTRGTRGRFPWRESGATDVASAHILSAASTQLSEREIAESYLQSEAPGFRRRALAAPLCRQAGELSSGTGADCRGGSLLSAHCRMQSGGLAARLIAVGALDEPHGSTSTSDAAGVLCSPAREQNRTWTQRAKRANAGRASAGHLKNRCRHRGGRGARTGHERRSVPRRSPSCPPRWA